MMNSVTKEDIVRMATQFFWKCMEKYTYVSMGFKKYAMPLIKKYILDKKEINNTNGTKDYPFLLVQDNTLSYVYYDTIEPCNFEFIQTQLEVNGERHDIDLSQFMVVDNVLFHYGFARWILKEQKGIDIDDNDPYTVHIIDQNANIYEVSNDKYIIIYRDEWAVEDQDDEKNQENQKENQEGLGSGSQEEK